REAHLHLARTPPRRDLPLERHRPLGRRGAVHATQHDHLRGVRRRGGDQETEDAEDEGPAEHRGQSTRFPAVSCAGLYRPRMPEFDWERPLADLHELRELTGGPDGARRLAWSANWRKAREWLLGKLEPLKMEVQRDATGNLWATRQ